MFTVSVASVSTEIYITGRSWIKTMDSETLQLINYTRLRNLRVVENIIRQLVCTIVLVEIVSDVTRVYPITNKKEIHINFASQAHFLRLALQP